MKYKSTDGSYFEIISMDENFVYLSTEQGTPSNSYSGGIDKCEIIKRRIWNMLVDAQPCE